MKIRFSLFRTLLLSLLLFSIFTTSVSSHSGDETQKHTALYDVLKTTNNSYSWYDTSSGSTSYTIPENTEIEVELANPTDINTELNITIGNFTQTKTTDVVATSNLGIGYYNFTNLFGFIANSSWSDVGMELSKQNFTASELLTDQQYQFGAANFTAVEISFNDGFQFTELIYNQRNGLLYYANVSIGGFELEMEITGYIPGGEDDHIIPSSNQEETDFTHFTLIFTLLVSVSLLRKSQFK